MNNELSEMFIITRRICLPAPIDPIYSILLMLAPTRPPRSQRKRSKAPLAQLIRNNGGNPVVTDIGQVLAEFTIDATSGNAVVPLTPDTLASRTMQLCEAYNMYRFVGLELEFFPNAGSFTAAVVIDDIDSTTSTSLSQSSASQLPFSLYVPNSLTVPQRIVIPRKDLIGKSAANWFKSNSSSSADSWDEIQVVVVLSGGPPTTGVNFIIRWLLEFTDPAPPALLPNPFKNLLVAKHRPKVKSMNH